MFIFFKKSNKFITISKLDIYYHYKWRYQATSISSYSIKLYIIWKICIYLKYFNSDLYVSLHRIKQNIEREIKDTKELIRADTHWWRCCRRRSIGIYQIIQNAKKRGKNMKTRRMSVSRRRNLQTIIWSEARNQSSL